jgi:hypothetical protein
MSKLYDLLSNGDVANLQLAVEIMNGLHHDDNYVVELINYMLVCNETHTVFYLGDRWNRIVIERPINGITFELIRPTVKYIPHPNRLEGLIRKYLYDTYFGISTVYKVEYEYETRRVLIPVVDYASDWVSFADDDGHLKVGEHRSLITADDYLTLVSILDTIASLGVESLKLI